MFGSGRPSIIFTTLKIVIVVGALSWVAADWVSQGFDRDALARLASDGERGREPLITGSLGLDRVRLDPCGDEAPR
ncbi:hypothetical protein [Salinarimonas chemoclinalis]|uniref:hypothetical protein n=1 Tax=Salinarimonas chemoclinalis TaxID=3241599 RepID=UPI0035561ED7